jgi:cytochrome c peroxidase
MRASVGWGFWLCSLFFGATTAIAQPAMTPVQALGRAIFFDASLSEPAGQSCASCHAPDFGFASPIGAILEGAVPGRFGNRTPPAIAYAAFTPILHWDKLEKTYSGGQFRDGRAADLVEQAKGPLTNPVEMNNRDLASVCRKVAAGSYAAAFAAAFAEPLDCATTGADRILQALAAYEAGPEVNPFSSKYDLALAGTVQLTAQEVHGYQLFKGEAGCERCHPSSPGPRGEPPLFTDFGYDNIGAPKNARNPFYAQPRQVNPDGASYIDRGLGAVLKRPAEYGKFRSPSLRNIAVNEATRAYMHNGSLIGLREVLDFYNRRDADPGRWAPEVADTVNKTDLGDLKLSDQDIDDLLAFLRTLTDGWKPAAPSPAR